MPLVKCKECRWCQKLKDGTWRCEAHAPTWTAQGGTLATWPRVDPEHAPVCADAQPAAPA